MLTVKDFECLGVVFVNGDAGDRFHVSCASVFNSSEVFNERGVTYFAWRPLNTLPDNPKFKYELDYSKAEIKWRPLLDQSVKLLNEDSLSGKILNIGNVLHNISCSMTSDNEQDEFAEYASTCWSMANILSNEVESFSDDKPVFTQAMADAGEFPPVGSKFLYSYIANPKENDWHEVESKYVDGDCMFFKGSGGVRGFMNIGDMFCSPCKPLDTRTPKQKAVDEMFEDAGVQGSKGAFERLYDKGYRKR